MLHPFSGSEIWCEGGAVGAPLRSGLGELLRVSKSPRFLGKWVRKAAVAFSIRDLQRREAKPRTKALSTGFPLPSANNSCYLSRKSVRFLDFDSTLGFPGKGAWFPGRSVLLHLFCLSRSRAVLSSSTSFACRLELLSSPPGMLLMPLEQPRGLPLDFRVVVQFCPVRGLTGLTCFVRSLSILS